MTRDNLQPMEIPGWPTTSISGTTAGFETADRAEGQAVIDPFADPDRPHMARGTHSLGGMSIVVTPHMPKNHIGDAIAPKPRLVRWLLRWVPRRWRAPWYRVGARIEEDQFIVAAGKVFCTPATYQRLRASMKGRKS